MKKYLKSINSILSVVKENHRLDLWSKYDCINFLEDYVMNCIDLSNEEYNIVYNEIRRYESLNEA